MHDILNYEERTILKLRSLYRRHGYRSYKVSKFEEYDLYAENKRFLGSSDIITFTDRSGKLMALKPDVTLSVIKNYSDDGTMEKICYDERVYRASAYDRLYQEITQTGLECMGELDDYTVGEVMGLAAASLEMIRPEYVLAVSHMGFVSGLFSEMELNCQQRSRLLKAISQKNMGDICSVLELWGVEKELAELVCSVSALYGPLGEMLDKLEAMSLNREMSLACGELRRLWDMLVIGGRARGVYLDFSITGETEYYNGVTFKGFVDGVPAAVLSGGRYDGLMEKLGKKAGAIGFAVYLDLLERLSPADKSWDVDILLRYGKNDDSARVAVAVKRLVDSGCSVRAQKGEAGNIRCRKTLVFGTAEVEDFETNA